MSKPKIKATYKEGIATVIIGAREVDVVCKHTAEMIVEGFRSDKVDAIALSCAYLHLRRQLAEAQAEKNRLVRDLDVLWNGEEGAAKQASLCDMVAQISKELPSLREAQARLAELDKLERYAYMHGKAFKDGKVIDADIPLYRIREEQ